jgi:ribosomal protein S18 acetylase RimI-like enzyme
MMSKKSSSIFRKAEQRMQIDIAQGIDLPVLAEAFTRGYENYIVPVKMTTESLERFIRQNDIDLAASRVARDDAGDIIGIGMLGIRGRRGWIGSVGVALPHRRTGVGRALMHSLIESARTHQIADLYLEVITTNASAHALYVSLGFKMLRRLLILNADNMTVNEANPASIQSIAPAEALKHYDALHSRANPWQRQRESLEKTLDGVEGLALWQDSSLRAYLLYRRLPQGGYNWVDFGAAPQDEATIRELACAAHESGAHTMMINLGEDEPVWLPLEKMNCRVDLMQYEMYLNLS